MAKFLNSSGTTYHLEELIKNASDRLIIISPYLKLNERIKELLEDRNRLKLILESFMVKMIYTLKKSIGLKI